MPDPTTALRPQLRSWSWIFGARVLQVVAQAASFLLVARVLGARDFGVYVSFTAVTAILSPFVGLGAANLLIRDVARDPRAFAERWQTLLGMTLLTGVLLGVAGVAVCRWLAPGVPLDEIVWLVAANLLLLRSVQLTQLALQGLGRMQRMAQIDMLLSAVRVAAALVLFALPPALRQLRSWLLIYLAAAVLVSAAVLLRATRAFGRPRLARAAVLRDWKEGLWFTLSPFALIVNNDADKVVLAGLAGPQSVGIYGAAYRLLSAAFLPVQAQLTVTYPQFFRHGRRGIRASTRYARRWLPLASGYCLLVALLLLVGAPLLARILGPGYAQTATVLRYLAVLPLLKTVQYLFADALTGADHQPLRVGLQAFAALLNVALNLAWVPRYGWGGAVRATLVSDGALALLLVAAALKLGRKEAAPVPS